MNIGSIGDEQAREVADALTQWCAETGRVLFSADGVRETLSQAVAVAVNTIESCDSASLYVVEKATAICLVRSDPRLAVVDSSLEHFVEGPLGDVIQNHQVVCAMDFRSEERWPTFTSAATSAGLRGLLTLPLMLSEQPGALNLYARCPDAFGVFDRGRAEILAMFAEASLSTAMVLEDQARRAENLRSALWSREVIGQAEGILMERERISADQAFDILRAASQRRNVKLRQIARDLVETGEIPIIE